LRIQDGRIFDPFRVSINRGMVVAMEEDGFKVKRDAEDAG